MRLAVDSRTSAKRQSYHNDEPAVNNKVIVYWFSREKLLYQFIVSFHANIPFLYPVKKMEHWREVS